LRASKVVPLAALALIGVAWIAVRPFVAVPHLLLYEFPIGAALVALLVWIALRKPKRGGPASPAWRKHEQVVRPLPDPEAARLEAALENWARTGDGVQEAATVVAAARGDDAARYLPLLSKPTRERQRRALLAKLTERSPEPGA